MILTSQRQVDFLDRLLEEDGFLVIGRQDQFVAVAVELHKGGAVYMDLDSHNAWNVWLTGDGRRDYDFYSRIRENRA